MNAHGGRGRELVVPETWNAATKQPLNKAAIRTVFMDVERKAGVEHQEWRAFYCLRRQRDHRTSESPDSDDRCRGFVGSARGRTRTYDPLINSQVL